MEQIHINNGKEVHDAIENFNTEEFMNKSSCGFEYKIESQGRIIIFYPFPFKEIPSRASSSISVYMPSVWFDKYEPSNINWNGCGDVNPIEAGLYGKCLSYAAMVAQEIDKHFEKIIDVTEKKEEVTG